MPDDSDQTNPVSGTREAFLARELLSGVEHLRQGRAAEAAAALERVCDAPELATAQDLLDVRLRAHTLLTQALLDLGRLSDAAIRLKAADALAEGALAREASGAITALRERLQDAERRRQDELTQAERAGRLASLSVEEIEARVRSEPARVEVLVRKANADADHGNLRSAEQIATRALQGAIALGDPRLEVLARLSIARASSDQAAAQVLEALGCADRSGDTGLITAVAKAAALHEVPLPTYPAAGSATPTGESERDHNVEPAEEETGGQIHLHGSGRPESQ